MTEIFENGSKKNAGEQPVKRKKTYSELLEALGKALIERGDLEEELTNEIAARKEQKRRAKRAKWFSEDRYEKWAEYFAIKAKIVAIKTDIKKNNHQIATLENLIAYNRRSTSTATPNSE